MTPTDNRSAVMARSAAVLGGVIVAGAAFAALPEVVRLMEPTGSPMEVVRREAAAPAALAAPVNVARLSGLLAPEPDVPQDFLPIAAPAGGTICGALADAGFANSGWTRSAIAPGRWECYAATGGTGDAAPYGVFYMLRGAGDRLEEMRLKLTLRDSRASASLRSEVASFLEAFAGSAHVAFPPAFLASVNAGGWATYVSPQAIYTFAPEDGAVPRWNLSIAFAGPGGIARAGEALSLPAKAVRGIRATPQQRPPAEPAGPHRSGSAIE